MASKSRYHDLRASIEEEQDDFSLRRNSKSAFAFSDAPPTPARRNRLVFTTLAIMAALAFYTAIVLAIPRAINFHHTYDHLNKKNGHCGNSSKEAEALGCKFDIMYWGWVHPNCYNETEARIWENKYGPWWWKKRMPDGNPYLNENLTRKELKYQDVVWATDHYHLVHCLYSLKMVHMAGLNGYLVSPEVGPLEHTDHCIERVMNYDKDFPQLFQTEVHNYYSTCYKLDP